MTTRKVAQHWQAIATSDGAGVSLRRALGTSAQTRLNPFLMLDNFSSDNPDDYIAGFPAHPHRGFETVTYIIDGHMRHRDHLGNEGDLQAGGVQWMTAGSGIIHEEMPQQTDGLLRGFQLWLNLPAKDKMQRAHYRDIASTEMPWQALAGGGQIKLIAGSLDGNSIIPDVSRITAPIIADLALPAGNAITPNVPEEQNAALYVFEGELVINGQTFGETTLVELGKGDKLHLEAGDKGARMLFISGTPLNEPISQYGPFVMNTEAEIRQAIEAYQRGELTV